MRHSCEAPFAETGLEADGDCSSAAASADRLLLWAVAGLSGVVIGGRPSSSAAGRGARAPRAVLWGQHAGSLVWRSQAQVPSHLLIKEIKSPSEGNENVSWVTSWRVSNLARMRAAKSGVTKLRCNHTFNILRRSLCLQV